LVAIEEDEEEDFDFMIHDIRKTSADLPSISRAGNYSADSDS
jgi:hypothetical protein